jgi:hypothetical protein
MQVHHHVRGGNVLATAKARFHARIQGLLLSALASACGREAGSGADGWEFKVDTVRQTAWLRAVGKEARKDEAPNKAAILSFDCLPGQRSITIMTEQALRQGSTEARVQLDASRPRRIPAFAGTTASSGQVVLTISPDSMLTLLTGHQRATIEYTDGAGSSRTTAEFPLLGLEKYRAPFLRACAD